MAHRVQVSTWDGLDHRLRDLRRFIEIEIPNSRDRSLAFTKIDEAEAWLERALDRWHLFDGAPDATGATATAEPAESPTTAQPG